MFGSIPMQASQQKDAFASYLTANFQAVSRFSGCGFSCFIASGCGIFELMSIFMAFGLFLLGP